MMDERCKKKKPKVSKKCFNGLREGQPLRIRRATLLSLLSISHTFLHSQRTVKTIIDSILGLSLNDLPSNLAAATLFYILTIDNGQDDHLLESPGSIRFLIKLLRPTGYKVEDKARSFGSRLLALQKKPDKLKNRREKMDSSSVSIFSRVEEILVNCKEVKLNHSRVERPELCPEWLALLTIEKACLFDISLDGAVEKTGGNFMKKLRELGGLDAVFEITMNCQSDLKCWMEDSSLSIKDQNQLKSLTLLLKCLKIMENFTLLSKDNQTHLLGLKRKLSPQATPFSFVELVMTIIKFLSDLCLSQNASAISFFLKDNKENETVFSNSTGVNDDIKRTSSVKSFNHFKKCQLLTSTRLESSQSISETETTSSSKAYICSQNMITSSSTCGSCSGASRGSGSKTSMIQVEILDNSRDPFAFDEDDIEPFKRDLLSGKRKLSHSKNDKVTKREFEDRCQSQTKVSRQELNDVGANCSSSYIGDEAISNLLADCLLAAIKVLLNLTNDNPVGCQQVAAYGGLEILPSLIVGHFPSFSLSSLSFAQIKENTPKSGKDYQLDRHLTDHELDFLVAILGLLVNLIEKDGHNRSRLAAASFLLSTSEGLKQKTRRGVIQLLCAIFLANQSGEEEAEEEKYLPLDDETALLLGEKEAEKMIVEAYSALLLAFLSTETKSVQEAIADNLPNHNLSILVPVLNRFMEFHLTLNIISRETHKAVSEIIESCRIT